MNKTETIRGEGPTKRNEHARALALPQYAAKVVPNKKAYNRKREQRCISE